MFKRWYMGDTRVIFSIVCEVYLSDAIYSSVILFLAPGFDYLQLLFPSLDRI